MNADVMDSEMLERYKSSPEKLDSEVRQRFGIPENRYYTVAVFPPTVAGKVTIERERLVKAHKISKSDAN